MLSEWWPDSIIISQNILRGGYSCTNYKIETNDGNLAVIKICNGYSLEDIERQAEVTDYIKSSNFMHACYPYKLFKKLNNFKYVTKTKDNQPVLLYSYINGIAADIMIESGRVNMLDILNKIGKYLANLHLIPINILPNSISTNKISSTVIPSKIIPNVLGISFLIFSFISSNTSTLYFSLVCLLINNFFSTNVDGRSVMIDTSFQQTVIVFGFFAYLFNHCINRSFRCL